MSSNGSNDTQLGRLDSLFGSQGSTRNFTSLLNPSYLQSPNGKESHKRETDGKYSALIVTHFDESFVVSLCRPSPTTNLRWYKDFFFAIPQIVKYMCEYEYYFFSQTHNEPFSSDLKSVQIESDADVHIFFGGGGLL
jgi:hypothetical protein